MKIGILTFHRAHNYGAFLQCYALAQFLKNLGHNAKVIDYHPNYFKKDYALIYFGDFKSLSLYKKVRRVLGNFLLFPLRLLRRASFEKDIKRFLGLGKKGFSFFCAKDFSFFDAIFFGSDQIWNPKLTRGFDKIFWGDFEFDGKKIAYAASAGDDFSVFSGQTENLKKRLLQFDFISVRENHLEFFLKNLGIKSRTVLDPTLLLESEEWEKFSASKKCQKKYVLLYVIKPSDAAPKIAKKVAKILNCKVREVFPSVVMKPKSARGFFDMFSSPKKFVRLFLNAEFVVTTSFHGTSFAINLQKPFYAVNNGTPNFRVESLLENCDLKNRYILSESEVDFEKNILLKKPNKECLKNMRELSKEFILRAIASAEQTGGGINALPLYLRARALCGLFIWRPHNENCNPHILLELRQLRPATASLRAAKIFARRGARSLSCALQRLA